jgi:hypothetical protein
MIWKNFENSNAVNRRPDNEMTKRKMTKGQTKHYTENNKKPTFKQMTKSGGPLGLAIPVPLVKPVVLPYC